MKLTMRSLNGDGNSRQADDFYATDPIAIDSLFAVQQFSKHIWEPSCGMGHLSDRMKQLGKEVYSTDLVDRGYGIAGIDFLKQSKRHGDIITNPPFKLAIEFIDHAINLTDGKVAMFLKLAFLEGVARRAFFKRYPPQRVFVFSRRCKCAKNGLFDEYGSAVAAFAWFVWDKHDLQCETKLDWC